MREILDRLDAAITGDRFDPARSDATFRIATTGYVSAILIPNLLRDMEQQAPLSTLGIRMADDRMFHELIAGPNDAALSKHLTQRHVIIRVAGRRFVDAKERRWASPVSFSA